MEVLTTLNSMSSLGVIALLAYVIYLQVRNQRRVKSLGDNHLSGLPDMHETLKRIEMRLGEVADHVVWLRARMNGK